MAEIGLGFLPDMVRALRRPVNPKTQTRRLTLPKGMQVGSRIWVREAYRVLSPYDAIPPRDVPKTSGVAYEADRFDKGVPTGYGKQRPGMFMCRWMSRIELVCTALSQEHLQVISREDAIAEGILPMDGARGRRWENAFCPGDYDNAWESPINAYASLWDRINGDMVWNKNPLLWRIEFKEKKHV